MIGTAARPRRIGPALIAALIAAAGLAVLGVAALAVLLRPPPPVHTVAISATPAMVQSSAPAQVAATVKPAPTPPSFDIIRIAPDGQAVIAGRASPGAEVTIQDRDRTVGRVQANAQGSWVFVPAAPLPPGQTELSLSERAPGGIMVAGIGSAMLAVPARAANPTPALAVLTAPNTAPVVLQAPGRTPGKLALDAVEYGPAGDVHLAGSARPGALVRVYVDNVPVGEARADRHGGWVLAQAAVAPGMHRLRLDQIGDAGKVATRVELPFSRETTPTAGNVVVQPGASLWRLARQAYGSGTRYTVIYAANREEIHDPRLIYPGQVLTVPASPP